MLAGKADPAVHDGIISPCYHESSSIGKVARKGRLTQAGRRTAKLHAAFVRNMHQPLDGTSAAAAGHIGLDLVLPE